MGKFTKNDVRGAFTQAVVLCAPFVVGSLCTAVAGMTQMKQGDLMSAKQIFALSAAMMTTALVCGGLLFGDELFSQRLNRQTRQEIRALGNG